jgi:Protein of unknown function (DUF2380)
MRILLLAWLTALAMSLPAASAEAAQSPRTVAYFGVLFLNTSPERTTPEEERRLAALDERLRQALAASGRYALLDTGPVADKAARYGNLAHCNGCDARLAGELGADLALTGEVQKTSNLILSISIYLRDAETGALVGGGSADIRGNTDESWARGIDYILRNRILRE